MRGSSKKMPKEEAEREMLRDFLSLYRGCIERLTELQKEDSEGCPDREEAAKTVNEINEIVSLLKIGSERRKIIEFRYKKRLNWKQICKRTYYSRSRAAGIEKEALDELLKNEGVRAVVLGSKAR